MPQKRFYVRAKAFTQIYCCKYVRVSLVRFCAGKYPGSLQEVHGDPGEVAAGAKNALIEGNMRPFLSPQQQGARVRSG